MSELAASVRMVWSAMPDGSIIVRANTQSILDMARMLKAPKGTRVSIADIDPWRRAMPVLDTDALVRYIAEDDG